MLKSVLNVTLFVVFLLCLISATVFFGGILPEYTLLLYSLFGLLAALWAVKLFCCRRVSVVWSPTHIPVFLFAGYAILRYAASPIEYDSRIELLHIGLYTLVYFVACCNFYRSRDRLTIISALAVLAFGETIYGLWQYQRQADVVLWLERGENYHGRASGTYFCPNHLAGLLEMALAIFVARLLANREPIDTLQSVLLRKLYESAAVVLFSLGLFATLSRGGWVSAAIALLVLLVWAELARMLSSRFAIALFCGLVLVGAVAWSVPRVRSRIEQQLRVDLDYVPGDTPIHIISGLEGRYPMWSATRRMIGEHLWMGTGPGTWQWFHLKYRDPRLQIRPQFAHNDVLHLASDYGLVGSALIVALLACFYRQTWRMSRRAESAEQRAFALGAGTAVTAILVHSLVDFNLHIPANALWLVTLLGLTVAQSSSGNDRSRRQLNEAGKIAIALIVLAAAAGIAWCGLKQAQSARFTQLGYDANERFEWDRAHALYQRAIHFDPRNPEPHSQLGDAYRMQSALAESDKEQPDRHRLALLAIDAYQHSLALNPFQSEVMLRLAAAYELAGDYAGAARTYTDSLTVDPNNAFNWLRIGMFYRRRGDTARAIEALRFSQRLNRLEPIADKYLKEIEDEQAHKP